MKGRVFGPIPKICQEVSGQKMDPSRKEGEHEELRENKKRGKKDSF